MGLATRLATLERKVATGKVKTKTGAVAGYDPLGQVHPDLRARMYKGEGGFLYYDLTGDEQEAVAAILADAYRLNGFGGVDVPAVAQDHGDIEAHRAATEAQHDAELERAGHLPAVTRAPSMWYQNAKREGRRNGRNRY